MCRRPLELQEEHGFIAHAARPSQHGFDRGVQRLDDTEPHRVKAVRRDPLEVLHEEGPQSFHLGESLPAQGLQPAEEKVTDALRGLVGPQAIELLTQEVGLEQPAVGREERFQFAAF